MSRRDVGQPVGDSLTDHTGSPSLAPPMIDAWRLLTINDIGRIVGEAPETEICP